MEYDTAVSISAPPGFSWDQLVAHWVQIYGGWVPLADELIRKVGIAGGEAPELDATHKGLRRLAKRAQGSGGQYGGWLLRHFGVPDNVEQRLRWFAQYHSRFADMPSSVRLDQLALWDRPPTSESRLIAWVHVGLASIAHRREQADLCNERLHAARRSAAAAGPLAQLETGLLHARTLHDHRAALQVLDTLEPLLESGEHYVPYRARLVGQRAFALTRLEPAPSGHERARALFESLPTDSGIAFVDYRRTAGLAFSTWKLGDTQTALGLAQQACEHAGDGGYVRFRVMALNMLARMHGGEEAKTLRARAARLAATIEDVHLQHVATFVDP